ncbi:hypothetical protein [Paenibacillus agri]|uniref:Uncharacterized protein n=1 Tax=Paenibacillus agri TaxID=2744309 RepID=A0A850ER70_9BACL|nr:hypothetical protein [Paenibacillus agri]NUU62239.1 hypothetical protein [Paenibacillus agri]
MNLHRYVGYRWSRGILLGLSVLLGTGTGASVFQPQAADAAAAQQTATVYKQFEKYVKNPDSLAQARNYLINHIKDVGVWQATVMTLHLENAQVAQLPIFSEKMYGEKVQTTIRAAAQPKELTYTGLLSKITDPNVRAVLIEARDKGYKLDSSEGMYYPVMHYEGFKIFKPFIQKDIAEYIDLMAVESNQPMTRDAAIVIGWDQVISRTLSKEAFVKKYPASNRKEAVKLKLSLSRVFFGASNTPAYDGPVGEPPKLNPKLRAAYETALNNGPGSSELLQTIAKLLELLDSSNDELTPEVQQFLDKHVK